MKKYLILIVSTVLSMCALYYLLNINSIAYESKIEEIEVVETKKEEVIEIDPMDIYKECDEENYHNELAKIAKDNKAYGMQVVVFKGDEILDSFNYGYSDMSRKILVDDATVFRIASTSKMISNMLIMKLVDEGKIDLDSNLKEITGLNFNPDIKLYQVLTHTSGIVDSSEFNDNMDKVLDINHLLDISCVHKPGSTYVYSNFGAGTMAAIIEKVTGEYFMDYARDNLFDYYDLNGAFVCEYLDEDTKVAKMYSDGEEIDPLTWEYNYDFYRSFELGKQYRLAYGNMYISASDLAKLGMVLAGDGSLKGKKLLSETALKEIRKVRDKAKGYNYEMALNTDCFSNLVEDRTIYGHTGSAYNALSCLMYDPVDQTGVVLLTNHAVNSKNKLGYTDIIYDVVNEAYKAFFTTKGEKDEC